MPTYPLSAGSIRQIPVLQLSYGHRLFGRLAQLGPADIEQLFAAVDSDSLFKRDQIHKAPRQRAQQIMRYARELGLVEGDRVFALTPAGLEYVEAASADDEWASTPRQAVLLQRQIARCAREGGSGLARGAALALSLIATADAPYSELELGHALGYLGGMEQWRAPSTFVSQARRFKALLEDAGLLDGHGRLTPAGTSLQEEHLIEPHPKLGEAVRGAEERSRSARRDVRDVEDGPKLFFFPAAGALAAEHMQTSLLAGVPLHWFEELDVFPSLEHHAKNGLIYAWGARPGDRAEGNWKRLRSGDVGLVYAGGHRFALWGRVYAKTKSEKLARRIWGEDKGEIWECMYFLDPVAPFDVDRVTVVEALGYKPAFIPQGFEIPKAAVQARILEEHGSIAGFLEDLKADAFPPRLTDLSSPSDAEDGPGEDPAIALLAGSLDTETLAKVRREQRKLRKQLLGKRKHAECALCGKDLPVNCLRAAHIKQRSKCSDDERRDARNLMLACTLGCDHLFELGYIHIDIDGEIRRTADRELTGDLDRALATLIDRPCAVHDQASEPYFAWHRQGAHNEQR